LSQKLSESELTGREPQAERPAQGRSARPASDLVQFSLDFRVSISSPLLQFFHDTQWPWLRIIPQVRTARSIIRTASTSTPARSRSTRQQLPRRQKRVP